MVISVQTYKDYAAFKKSIGVIQKEGTNPHFNSKFAELNTILEVIDNVIENKKEVIDDGIDNVIKPDDCKFIAYLQTAFHKDDKNFLKTQLIHESGEIIEMDLELITTKKDPQMIGSSLTYMRRYGLMTILGLRAEDDDGNQGSGKVKPASDADFNSAKKRMEKAKYAYSFKEFMAGFSKDKAYNSAQVELLEQVYDHEKAKIKPDLTPELVDKTKAAMKKKNFDGAFDQYLEMLQTMYTVSNEQEEDLKKYFLEESQKIALGDPNPNNIEDGDEPETGYRNK